MQGPIAEETRQNEPMASISPTPTKDSPEEFPQTIFKAVALSASGKPPSRARNAHGRPGKPE
jgi:hypothetical protein